MGDRTNIADALERMAVEAEDGYSIPAGPSEVTTFRDAARLLRADPDTSDEHKPCPHCNDEGVVCTLDGEIIGPCDCTSDELFAEARRLLDAATPGPWASTGGGFAQPAIVYAPGYEVIEGEGAARIAMCEFLDAPERRADAALIAAAPRLIAALLDERDAERVARERAEAEARQLREAIRAHENLHRPDGPDGADGPIEMDGWPCCNDDRLLWAAAVAEVAEDRGQTDG
jgi:hypothetical protein